MTEKSIKGPASYFPSIEKTYGRPISEWLEIVQRHPSTKHSELVAMLKVNTVWGMVTLMRSSPILCPCTIRTRLARNGVPSQDDASS